MRLIVRLAALSVILGLLVLMLTPQVHPPGPAGWGDKAWHVLGFFAITLSLQVAPVWRDRLGAALLAVLIGAGVEVVQEWVGRDRSLMDLVADAAGAAVGWWISPRLSPLMDWLDRRG
jgi:VanZ family protein